MKAISNKQLRWILSIFVIGVVATFTLFVLLNLGSRRMISIGTVKVESSGVTLNKVHYTEARDGRVEWKLEADSANYLKESDITIFNNVKVVFYADDGRLYTMTGSKGRFNNDNKDIEISGNILVVSDSGYKFRTELLRYDHSGQKIITDSKINIEGSDMKIDGVGIIIFLDRGYFSVLKDVRTLLKYALI